MGKKLRFVTLIAKVFGEELLVEVTRYRERETLLKIDKLQVGIIGHEVVTWLLVLVQDCILHWAMTSNMCECNVCLEAVYLKGKECLYVCKFLVPAQLISRPSR